MLFKKPHGNTSVDTKGLDDRKIFVKRILGKESECMIGTDGRHDTAQQKAFILFLTV
jgi:hypothetical protein